MSAQRTIFCSCVLGAALAAAAGLRAADKIELKGSTSLELPKPNRNIQESSRFKFDTSSGLESGGFLTPPSVENNGPADRKLRELLDKKKNWIFVNPYEQTFDERTSQILDTGKSEEGGLMEHRLLQEDEKGAMEKFFEEKDNKPQQRRSSDSSSSNSDAQRAEAQKNLPGSETQNGPFSEQKPEDKPVALFFGAENSMFKERESSFESSSFQKRMERTPVENTPTFGQSRFAETARPNRDENLRQQTETRETEFNRLLPNSGLIGIASPTAQSRLDQAFNPSLGANRGDSGFGARRSDTFGSAAPKSDFSGANRSGLSGIPSSLPGSSGPDIDISSRVSKGPSFLPSGPSISAPASGPAFNPSPFVHEIPRRKF